jgi:NADH dehydrogenase FAD-containing subunit
MLFTPLLASTAVGTLELRSITEPIKHAFPHVSVLNRGREGGRGGGGVRG